MDVVSPKTRSRMMSGIKSKNTTPERLMRKALHQRGFRYRLHYTALPGKPDMVFPRFKAVILINGCFWHGHNCHHFKWPRTRPEFWREKIESNRARDKKNRVIYRTKGWKTLVVWECSLKGRTQLGIDQVAEIAARWLQIDSQDAQIAGSPTESRP